MPLIITPHSSTFSSSPQLDLADVPQIASEGYRSIICNRPDDETGPAYATSEEVRAKAEAAGLQFAFLPVIPKQITPEQIASFASLLETLPGPVLGYCRTGSRSTSLYQSSILDAGSAVPAIDPESTFEVVIVGAGAAGIGVAASLLRRRPQIKIALIDPSDTHAYQPAWTLVGAGAFDITKTVRPTSGLIPRNATWLKAEVKTLSPENSTVLLDDGRAVRYEQLIVCPGLRLAWEKIEGLVDTLGQNGVTSNYRQDLAPYTWELVKSLQGGTALFSQPPMPIKCAGAPQKAMYLSCDHWFKTGKLNAIDVEFNLAGPALFGVAAFVPSLMKYVEKYKAKLVFNSTLVKVDGPSHTAWFDVKNSEGVVTRRERRFDMLHAVPPQVPPDVVRSSPLADAAGWCEVDQTTLQNPKFGNVFALGDACSAPNAKTAAAVRKQIVVVAVNLLAQRDGQPLPCKYDGYGACPLTVENGKVILAEFGYGGKLLPSFPLAPEVPRQSAWFLKATVLPWVYWNVMLKGREWLTDVSGA